eukprot:4050179-Pyramimonas_sp.AAC.1
MRAALAGLEGVARTVAVGGAGTARESNARGCYARGGVTRYLSGGLVVGLLKHKAAAAGLEALLLLPAACLE